MDACNEGKILTKLQVHSRLGFLMILEEDQDQVSQVITWLRRCT